MLRDHGLVAVLIVRLVPAVPVHRHQLRRRAVRGPTPPLPARQRRRDGPRQPRLRRARRVRHRAGGLAAAVSGCWCSRGRQLRRRRLDPRRRPRQPTGQRGAVGPARSACLTPRCGVASTRRWTAPPARSTTRRDPGPAHRAGPASGPGQRRRARRAAVVVRWPCGWSPGSSTDSTGRWRAARGAPTPGGADRATAGAGGFLDITADFFVYGATVSVSRSGRTPAYGRRRGGRSCWCCWPTTSTGPRSWRSPPSPSAPAGSPDDGRSLSFLGGLAEGTETIVVHARLAARPPARRRDRGRSGPPSSRSAPSQRMWSAATATCAEPGLLRPLLSGLRCSTHQRRAPARPASERRVAGVSSWSWTSEIAAFQAPSL